MKATIVALSLLAVGCSDSDNNTTPKADGTSPGTDGGAVADGSGDGATAVCARKDFPLSFGGLCFSEPKTAAKRTQCGEIVEDCDTSGNTTPVLACWESQPSAPAGPPTVTLTGYIDVFSNGPDADNLTIEVYDYAELQTAIAAGVTSGAIGPKWFPAVTPIATDTVRLDWSDKSKPPVDATRGPARACPADKNLQLPCTVPDDNCGGTGGTQPYCDLAGDRYCHAQECLERLRWETRYRIESMPTNKRLVIRTRGPGGFDDGTWGIMQMYNVYLRADAPKCAPGKFNDCLNEDGSYELEANALSRADYSTIPITAGLSGGIPPGKGAVAGEVHDCDDFKVEGFHVSSDPLPTVMVYFNGNPIKTLPDLGRFRFGTNADGIFAALDLAPGEVTLGAVGQIGGKTTTAGKVAAAALPDSVTVVTFDGPDPE